MTNRLIIPLTDKPVDCEPEFKKHMHMYCCLSDGEDVQECSLKHNDFCFVAVISFADQCATGIFHLCNIFSKGKARIISFAVGSFAHRPIKDQLRAFRIMPFVSREDFTNQLLHRTK